MKRTNKLTQGLRWLGIGSFVGLVLLGSISSFEWDATDNESSTCDDPLIKGNRTSYNGEWIYHMPSGQYYGVTDAEEYFCTREEAEEAGYRASER